MLTESDTAPRWLVITVVAAAIGFAALAGYVVGERRDHPGAEALDVGFLQDMIAHHEQALSLSSRELSAGLEPRVRSFAVEITRDQSYEIGLMERLLAEGGQPRRPDDPIAMRWMGEPVDRDAMPGMASEAELEALGSARGREADALFVPLMQDHHAGGVHMAEHAAQHTSNAIVRELATRMARNQRTEIQEMAQAQRATGLPTSPSGWTPDPILKAVTSASTRTTGHRHP